MRYTTNPYEVLCQMQVAYVTQCVNAYYAFWWGFVPKPLAAPVNVFDFR